MKQLFLALFLITNITAAHSYEVTSGSGLQFEEIIPADSYDPNNLGTVRGSVQEIFKIPKMTGMGDAVVAVFNSSKGKIYAILAPDWYLKNQNIDIKERQYLIVEGSRVDFKDKIVVIASSIQYDDTKVKLRDRITGNPEWSEWRKGEEIFYKNYTW
ncbi:MAG: hypothetical protein VX777_06330 [Chlamydiota bacterium]|nr:hypothetical protein [Chlamydiota bacterium]